MTHLAQIRELNAGFIPRPLHPLWQRRIDVVVVLREKVRLL